MLAVSNQRLTQLVQLGRIPHPAAVTPTSGPLVITLGARIRLRISVTDRCNIPVFTVCGNWCGVPKAADLLL